MASAEDGKVLCYLCQDYVGHKTSKCPNVRCKSCGEFGHVSKGCKALKKSSGFVPCKRKARLLDQETLVEKTNQENVQWKLTRLTLPPKTSNAARFQRIRDFNIKTKQDTNEADRVVTLVEAPDPISNDDRTITLIDLSDDESQSSSCGFIPVKRKKRSFESETLDGKINCYAQQNGIDLDQLVIRQVQRPCSESSSSTNAIRKLEAKPKKKRKALSPIDIDDVLDLEDSNSLLKKTDEFLQGHSAALSRSGQSHSSSTRSERSDRHSCYNDKERPCLECHQYKLSVSKTHLVNFDQIDPKTRCFSVNPFLEVSREERKVMVGHWMRLHCLKEHRYFRLASKKGLLNDEAKVPLIFELVPDFDLSIHPRPIVYMYDLIDTNIVAQFSKSVNDEIRKYCLEDVYASSFAKGKVIHISRRSKRTSIKLRLTKNTRIAEGERVRIIPNDEDLEVTDEELEVRYEKSSDRLVLFALINNHSNVPVEFSNSEIFGKVQISKCIS